MPLSHPRFLLSAIAIAASCAMAPGAFAAPTDRAPQSSFLTPQQQALDAVALSVLADPAVQAAREAALKRWGGHPAGTSADAKATLASSVDAMVYHALRAAAANDPVRPSVAWTLAPAHSLRSTKTPDSRFAGDNPDRIYRYAAVDPAWRYEIRGQRGAKPAQHEFSFESTSSISIIQPVQVALYSKDVDVARDGSFVITVDSSPADGRRNHLQLLPESRAILFRDTVPDWSADYNSLTVTRLDGDDKPAPSREEIVKTATAIIELCAERTPLLFDTAWKVPANEIRPFVRPNNWGVPGNVININRFNLAADEALVFTLLPSGANYLGVQLTNPWSRSVDYWTHTSSLSDHQAKPNADGSFTYVLAAKDPGVYNWLDNGGLRDGLIIARWELFAQPLPPGDAPQLVREVRKVKLGELATALPAGMAKVTPAQRRQQLNTRAAEYAKRVALK